MDEINKPQGDGLASDKPQGDGAASDSRSHGQSHKKVDESWKQNVEKEKSQTQASQDDQAQAKEGFVPPEANFKFFITTLTLQASIALGHMANPSTGKTEKDPVQAKFLIDTLAMLQEKTKGNLNKEETDLLESLLYELRVAYLTKEEDKTK